MDISQYFPIWNKLNTIQQAKIRELAQLRTVPAGTVLHDVGDNCLGLLLVHSGQLRAYLLSAEGREITICRFFEMDICLFSASCVMPNMQFDILVEAEKETTLWTIPACLYQNLMDESVAIANYSHNLIANHFSEVMWLMEQVMWKSFDKRLAKFLLEESVVESSSSLKLTHEKIANHLGSAREVVTRMLRYFQNEGMVRLTRGSVDILDEKRLRELGDI